MYWKAWGSRGSKLYKSSSIHVVEMFFIADQFVNTDECTRPTDSPIIQSRNQAQEMLQAKSPNPPSNARTYVIQLCHSSARRIGEKQPNSNRLSVLLIKYEKSMTKLEAEAGTDHADMPRT